MMSHETARLVPPDLFSIPSGRNCRQRHRQGSPWTKLSLVRADLKNTAGQHQPTGKLKKKKGGRYRLWLQDATCCSADENSRRRFSKVSITSSGKRTHITCTEPIKAPSSPSVSCIFKERNKVTSDPIICTNETLYTQSNRATVCCFILCF